MEKVDEINKSRYAQMQSSILNKNFQDSAISNNTSTSLNGSKLNLMGKFNLMVEDIKRIDQQTNSLNNSTRETSRVLDQMKKGIAEKQLGQCKLKCSNQVKKMEKFITYGISEATKRTEDLWGTCKRLTKDTENLKNLVTLLHNKLNNLQNVLGYYNGSEIVSGY